MTYFDHYPQQLHMLCRQSFWKVQCWLLRRQMGFAGSLHCKQLYDNGTESHEVTGFAQPLNWTYSYHLASF